jgi:NADH-quinone oxidoreductase subunit M
MPWLELAIFVPLLGALWTMLAPTVEEAQRRTLIASAVALGCAAGAWLDFDWIGAESDHDRWSLAAWALGFEPFAIDRISAPLFPIAALVYFVTALATLRTKARRFSFPWTLASEAVVLATLSCRDPWTLIPLLAIGVLPPLAELRARGKPTRVFAAHMSLFVALLLAGGWMAYGPSATDAPSFVGVLLLLAAVLVRSGVCPAHCWLTDLFEHAAFGSALLFVTPMIGVYAAVRLVLPIAPAWALQSMALLSLVTAVYAAGMALVQREARRFFCYVFLSHASLVLVGLELATPIGLTGALCLWISVGLALTGFGLTLRSIESRIGRVSLAEYHGLYEHAPMLGTFFLLTGLASIGFPGTIGFVGGELLVEGVVDVYPWVGLAVVAAAALNGIAVLQAYFRIFTGKRYLASISLGSRWQERVGVLALAALIIGGGLVPQPGLTSRRLAATQIINSRRSVAQAADIETSGRESAPWFADEHVGPADVASAESPTTTSAVIADDSPAAVEALQLSEPNPHSRR